MHSLEHLTRHRTLQLSALTICLTSLIAAAPSTAQVTGIPTSAANRGKLYDDLARDVQQLDGQFTILQKAVRLVRPTVVHIDAQKSERFQSRRRDFEEAGSGVVTNWDGKHFVLSNRHVIHGAALTDITIRLADGRELNPRQVWTHQPTDVAVMQIAADDLVPGRIGNSDKVEIGQFVMAAGSPFGLSHTVTFGIVSATGRRDLELGPQGRGVTFQEFIQTDAAINPGNSGGPLMNMRGEIVAINTAIASNSGGNEGIGFAIPINMVIHVARQLTSSGRVVRGYLGVQLDSSFDREDAKRLRLPRPIGARVSGVTPDSPAARSELKVDDVILKFDGIVIENDAHLVNRVGFTPIGKNVEVILMRAGKLTTIELTLTDRSRFEGR